MQNTSVNYSLVKPLNLLLLPLRTLGTPKPQTYPFLSDDAFCVLCALSKLCHRTQQHLAYVLSSHME